MGKFKFTSFYIKGRKVAQAKETSHKFTANGEQIIGDGEVLGESDGVVTSEVSFGAYIPIGGMDVDVVDLVIEQADVQVGALFNGKIYKIDGRFYEADVTSTSKTGVTEGKFSFRGGKPKATG